MPRNNDSFVLPIGPAELCFDKNEFMKKTFSVDDFLHEHRNVASLETMRDDLGIYLKVLRSAMIELINEDYGDFVNLSANLIGLDESINTIQRPLERLEEDIVNIKVILDDNITEVQNNLEYKKQLRNYKGNLRSLAKVHKSMTKLKELLEHLNDNLNPVALERATLENIKLNFNSQFCSTFLGDAERKTVENLHRTLLDKLKIYFLNSLKQDIDNLERCLRIYATLDECDTAEDVFRIEIVNKYMNKIISEQSLQNSPQGLTGIYSQILNFIPQHMKDLLLLTNHPGGKIKGFNFLINSFWADIESKIKTHMTSIFAPGNPDAFYMKYKDTQDFLEKVLCHMEDENLARKFQKSEQFKSFEARWNLPVYFQIRFQEIAGNFESACSQSIDDVLGKMKNSEMNVIRIAHSSILKCWENGIYIDKLFLRFWKLTLQIISRTSRWITEVLQAIKSKNTELDKISIYVLVYCETIEFKSKFPNILTLACNKLPKEFSSQEIRGVLEKCISDADENFANQINAIEKMLTEEIFIKSIANIRQVSDLPRLYRKTNRDIPNKQCAYVEQMMEPLIKFYNNYKDKIGEQKAKEILIKAFCSITVKYYSAVEDVLTSVQKTEESLRRLKNLREKTGGASVTNERSTLSDDDKIRLQLQVDVIFWVNGVEKFQIKRENVHKLLDLIGLVEDVTKLKISNK